ncbi:MAG TPA: methyltransferase domain-containing protein [Alphaproteobacteria bacterium]
MPINQDVEFHYARGDLVAALREALKAAGKHPTALTVDDLTVIDQMHVRGREATRELARRLDLTPDTRVLDVGSGIGGPSRLLAAEYGCHVVGIDITDDYCRAATAIAHWLGLDGRLEYRHGDALAMPFGDASFDVVWTQHAAMNIPDKARLYAEIFRVLRPNGRLALYDVLQGPGGAPHFPVPWASEPAISFLVTPDELRRLLEGAGFATESWTDRSAEGCAWARRTDERLSAGAAPPLGGALLHGGDFAVKVKNLRRNLEEQRIVLIEAICRRP